MAAQKNASSHGIIEIGTKRMKLKEWCNLPCFDGQRNTELRLEKAIRPGGHLSGDFMPTWTKVAAYYLDGVLHIVDGHTRALGWKTGKVTPPPDGMVKVDVYEVHSPEEAQELYDTFDNDKTSKNTADKIYGKMRQMGLTDQLKTAFLKNGGFAHALKMAAGPRVSIDLLLPRVQDALLLLDQINPKKGLFRTGILAAAFVTIRAFGQEAVTQFWGPYNARDFVVKGKKMNGPAALDKRNQLFLLAHLRGGEEEKAICLYAMDVCQKHLAGKTILLTSEPRFDEMIDEMLDLEKIPAFCKRLGLEYGAGSK
ncbi:MAG: hypothetical protein M0003_18655 [Acidithiobacillus sp.]|nr:hypothetical protein [Acidithiobacillus sp.]